MLSRTVWVTGAAGFTGRFMVQHLQRLTDPVRVVGLDLRVPTDLGPGVGERVGVAHPGRTPESR